LSILCMMHKKRHGFHQMNLLMSNMMWNFIELCWNVEWCHHFDVSYF
jgi:hypothetical protein